MKLRHVLVALAPLVLLSCSDEIPLMSTEAQPEYFLAEDAHAVTTYRYTGFNQRGAAVVQGYLRLSFGDSGAVTGRWNLRALVDTIYIGPQFGHGNLVGHLRNGMLSINLNPQYVDNNVLLMGTLTRTSYSGRWQWVGFPGVLNSGTFRAMRER